MGRPSKKISLQCPVCKRGFSRPPAHVRSLTLCCSRKCSNVFRPKQRPTVLRAKCKQCGCSFQRSKHRAGKMEYCSRQCARHGAAPRGENHPNWRGGISGRSHRTRSVIRDIVRQKGQCENCGAIHHLHGHHKMPHSSHPELRDEPSNIKVLCSQCHASEHPEIAGMIVFPKRRSGREIMCARCGRARYVSPFRLATAKFCSRRCQLDHLHLSMRAKFAQCQRESGPLS